jgi:lipoate-protein ligase A
LQRIGLQPELAACCDEAEADACFQRAVKYDVTMAGRKVAGAAQRRTKEGMLQQGSVLLDDPAYYAALAQILPGALAEILGETLVGSELTKEEQALATSLRDERYATMEWNQRR